MNKIGEIVKLIKMIILMMLLLTSSLVLKAQYPTTDHFTAIGGAGQWYNASGQGTMGVESGTLVCYNMSSTYAANSVYSWQSPDYGTQFVTDGCDSIKITFNVSLSIRTNDAFQFWWYNGGWSGASIPSTGTWTINLPKTTSYFSFDLVTGGNISGNPGNSYLRNGKYVHIDWFTIDCYATALPIELLSFNCKVIDNRNIKVLWSTASQSNNDYFIVEHSIDGYEWTQLQKIKGAGNSYQIMNYSIIHYNPYNGINYYRLKQVDYDGKSETFNIEACNKTIIKNIDKIIYYNAIGQIVNEEYNSGILIKFILYMDGTTEVVRQFAIE